MSKYTKIVATISDARCDVDFIKQLYECGMNVVRLNSAHLQEEGFQKIINNVRAVSNKIAILMDTKGPEVRTTPLAPTVQTFNFQPATSYALPGKKAPSPGTVISA